MTEDEAMLAIRDILDGTEWSIDLLWEIVGILAQAGYQLTD